MEEASCEIKPRSVFSFIFIPAHSLRMDELMKIKKRRRAMRQRTAPLNSSTLLSLQSIHFFKLIGGQSMKKWLMKRREKKRIVDEFIWRLSCASNQLKKINFIFFIGCGRQWNSWSCWLGLLSLLPAAVMGWLASQGLRQREDKPTQTTNNKWMELKDWWIVNETLEWKQTLEWRLVGRKEREQRNEKSWMNGADGSGLLPRPAEWPST